MVLDRASAGRLEREMRRWIERRLAAGEAGRLADATERRLYEVAREACDLGDVEELRRLADAASVCEAVGARSVDDLAHAMGRLQEGVDGLTTLSWTVS